MSFWESLTFLESVCHLWHLRMLPGVAVVLKHGGHFNRHILGSNWPLIDLHPSFGAFYMSVSGWRVAHAGLSGSCWTSRRAGGGGGGSGGQWGGERGSDVAHS